MEIITFTDLPYTGNRPDAMSPGFFGAVYSSLGIEKMENLRKISYL
jgi:hypothetical protein